MVARTHWVSIRIDCRIDSANRVAESLRDLPTDLALEQCEETVIALRELLINAVEHGGHLDPAQSVDLLFIRSARSIICYIRDPGDGFSFDKAGRSAISNDPEHLFRHLEFRAEQGMRPGGMGLLIAKQIADDLIYSPRGNELMFVKYL